MKHSQPNKPSKGSPVESPAELEISSTNTPPVLSSSPSSKKNKLKKPILIIVGVAIMLSMILVAWLVIGISTPKNSRDDANVVCKVEQGSSIDSIAARLTSEGLITNKSLFAIYAKFGPSRGNLRPGSYLLSPSMSLARIADLLGSGAISTEKVTFQEGLTIEEMARKWAKSGLGDAQAFIKASKPPNSYTQGFLAYRSNKDSLEGYLFPATYDILLSSTPQEQISSMLDSFAAQVIPKLSPDIANSTKLNDLITLASIVEKEANTLEDRKLVASVFYNRLKIGMKLESDVTVNYATGKTQTLPADLKIDSPYNTYRVSGLPLGPICNPGLESIMATANPAVSEYLFFLADENGKGVFAKTYEEHQQNIERYLN